MNRLVFCVPVCVCVRVNARSQNALCLLFVVFVAFWNFSELFAVRNCFHIRTTSSFGVHSSYLQMIHFGFNMLHFNTPVLGPTTPRYPTATTTTTMTKTTTNNFLIFDVFFPAIFQRRHRQWIEISNSMRKRFLTIFPEIPFHSMNFPLAHANVSIE